MPGLYGRNMGNFMMRALVNGKMVGRVVGADSEEEARARFTEELPEMMAAEARAGMDAAGLGVSSAAHAMGVGEDPVSSRARIARGDTALDGRRFTGIEFRCSGCGSALEAVFQDGFLQVAPCPVCLGELESMVQATERFLERRKPVAAEAPVAYPKNVDEARGKAEDGDQEAGGVPGEEGSGEGGEGRAGEDPL